jgi:hypothetical protein
MKLKEKNNNSWNFSKFDKWFKIKKLVLKSGNLKLKIIYKNKNSRITNNANMFPKS